MLSVRTVHEGVTTSPDEMLRLSYYSAHVIDQMPLREACRNHLRFPNKWIESTYPPDCLHLHYLTIAQFLAFVNCTSNSGCKILHYQMKRGMHLSYENHS
jgi:hypothetical protein